MERANKFFMFSTLADHVNCDFRRFDDKMIITFCHADDLDHGDRLTVTIRTENIIEGGQTLRAEFVSYELETPKGSIKQADSRPIWSPERVLMFVNAIVKDVFPAK